MINMKNARKTLAALAAAVGIAVTVQAQEVALYQFNKNLNSANGGDPISELFASGEFGTTESFAIGAINGESAQVTTGANGCGQVPRMSWKRTNRFQRVPTDRYSLRYD